MDAARPESRSVERQRGHVRETVRKDETESKLAPALPATPAVSAKQQRLRASSETTAAPASRKSAKRFTLKPVALTAEAQQELLLSGFRRVLARARAPRGRRPPRRVASVVCQVVSAAGTTDTGNDSSASNGTEAMDALTECMLAEIEADPQAHMDLTMAWLFHEWWRETLHEAGSSDGGNDTAMKEEQDGDDESSSSSSSSSPTVLRRYSACAERCLRALLGRLPASEAAAQRLLADSPRVTAAMLTPVAALLQQPNSSSSDGGAGGDDDGGADEDRNQKVSFALRTLAALAERRVDCRRRCTEALLATAAVHDNAIGAAATNACIRLYEVRVLRLTHALDHNPSRNLFSWPTNTSHLSSFLLPLSSFAFKTGLEGLRTHISDSAIESMRAALTSTGLFAIVAHHFWGVAHKDHLC